jgi:hypothetical protein
LKLLHQFDLRQAFFRTSHSHQIERIVSNDHEIAPPRKKAYI